MGLRVWRGEERLWKVYWLVAIVGGRALSIIAGSLVRTGFLNELLGAALLAVYAVFSGVGVWRCAFNVQRPVWGYATRTIIFVSTAYIMVAMILGVIAG